LIQVRMILFHSRKWAHDEVCFYSGQMDSFRDGDMTPVKPIRLVLGKTLCLY
jgi:hypothetical protein